MDKFNENERIDDLNINGLKVIQNREYFMFGIDSVILSSMVKSQASSNVIVDFCTGSAVIPILLTTRVKYQRIIGVELQEEMYDLAERNVAMNNLSDSISVLNQDIKEYKDIIKYVRDNVNKSGNVDVVVCNPPYKEAGTGIVNENTVKYIARHEDKCTLEDIFISASKLLKTKGKLYLVHKPDRLADLICMARKYNLEVKEITMLQPTKSKKPSIVFLEYVKDGNKGVNILPNILEYDENGNYTNKIKEIYRMEK